MPVALREDVQAVLDALERKGQVILHGPPGTGKTRLALGAALALDNRADVLGADAGQRAEAQAEMLHGDRVRMVTFHPSYGYEDFVEGFKLDLSATEPGLTLALADGLSTACAAGPPPIPARHSCWSSMRSTAVTCHGSSES
ncbi:hypothetical protein [Streptomyces lydicus]|uniref:hypothetical protein n=1 Tax=Streptomyces lydicus TaxID=47763 RepID=UPI0036FC33BA